MPTVNFEPCSKFCIFCGSGNLSRYKSRASDATYPCLVNIVECKSCNFAWQHPVDRSKEQSTEYFKAAYLDNGKSTSSYFSENKRRDIAKLEFEFLASLPVSGKKLLDIGAGAGIFAELAAEKDWNVTGVDPAMDVSRFSNNPKVTAINGSLHELPKGQLFDAITLWDVIEHIPNPATVIDEIQSYLKDDGWLVIETGNFKSADRVADGKNHWIYQFDHRWYFSPETIEKLLVDFGFSEFIFSKSVFRPGWTGSVSYPGPSRYQTMSSIIKDPLNLPDHISKHVNLVRAKKWKMPGIGIFTVAAKNGRHNSK